MTRDITTYKEGKVTRDAPVTSTLQVLVVETYRRENQCQFCGETKRESMLYMAIETCGLCVEITACDACLADVGYGPEAEEAGAG